MARVLGRPACDAQNQTQKSADAEWCQKLSATGAYLGLMRRSLAVIITQIDSPDRCHLLHTDFTEREYSL